MTISDERINYCIFFYLHQLFAASVKLKPEGQVAAIRAYTVINSMHTCNPPTRRYVQVFQRLS